MACYKPLRGWIGKGGGWVRSIESADRLNPQKMDVACGKCIGCRLDHSKEWAIRCMHEAQMHEHNHFVTLTYAPENLPSDGSLNKKHFQLFLKRVRKNSKQEVRVFHCGEYGEKLQRPHYHALLFGLELDDLYPFKRFNGNLYFRSPQLEKDWGKGFVTLGSVTFESAAYVARYIMKKQGGDKAYLHYLNEHGVMLQPEYAHMSLKPGIGYEWYQKYGDTDCHTHDYVVMDGKRHKVPRYYDELLRRKDPERLESLKKARGENCDRDTTTERLKVRENVKRAQIKTLKRTFESDGAGTKIEELLQYR